MTSLGTFATNLLVLVISAALASKAVGALTMRQLAEHGQRARSVVELKTKDGQGTYVLSFGDPKTAFESWKAKYGPKMLSFRTGAENDLKAYATFRSNLEYIESHNRKYARGEVSFFMGLNQFAAMTTTEFHRYNRLGDHSFTARGNMTRVSLTQDECQEDRFYQNPEARGKHDPDSLDWAEKGYVTDVKNQGDCGSCWIFSATGAMEGGNVHRHGKLVSLSEQEILDCCRLPGCDGCQGGFPTAAFSMVKHKGGDETEGEYPYKAWSGRCHMKKAKVAAKVKDCFQVSPAEDEGALKHACAKAGPISVAIDASHQSFQFYEGGIYYEPRCGSGPESLDHAVLVTGYGTSDRTGEDYWRVKNSWSTDWGMAGYVLMARGEENNCGIATEATYVTML